MATLKRHRGEGHKLTAETADGRTLGGKPQNLSATPNTELTSERQNATENKTEPRPGRQDQHTAETRGGGGQIEKTRQGTAARAKMTSGTRPVTAQTTPRTDPGRTKSGQLTSQARLELPADKLRIANLKLSNTKL